MADRVDEALGAAVCRLKLDDDVQRMVLAEIGTDDQEWACVESRRRALTEKLAWQRQLLQDGDIDQTAYRAKKAEIEAELATLAPRGSVTIDHAVALLAVLGTVWRDGGAEKRKALAGKIFEAIYVDPDRPDDFWVQIREALHPLWSALPKMCITRGSDGRRDIIHTMWDLSMLDVWVA